MLHKPVIQCYIIISDSFSYLEKQNPLTTQKHTKPSRQFVLITRISTNIEPCSCSCPAERIPTAQLFLEASVAPPQTISPHVCTRWLTHSVPSPHTANLFPFHLYIPHTQNTPQGSCARTGLMLGGGGGSMDSFQESSPSLSSYPLLIFQFSQPESGKCE